MVFEGFEFASLDWKSVGRKQLNCCMIYFMLSDIIFHTEIHEAKASDALRMQWLLWFHTSMMQLTCLS